MWIINRNRKHPAWFWCLLNSPSCEEGWAQVLRGASEVQPRPPDAVPLPPLWHHGQRTASHSILILCRNNGGKFHITLENRGRCFVLEASASKQLFINLSVKLMAFFCHWAVYELTHGGTISIVLWALDHVNIPYFCINLLSLILSNHNAIMSSVCTVAKAWVSHARVTFKRN